MGAIKFDSLINIVVESIPGISNELVINQLPVIMFGLVCFASLMTSITSSMISLENKTFSLLKSLPIKSSKINNSKEELIEESKQKINIDLKHTINKKEME